MHLVSRAWWSTLSKALLKLTRRIRMMVSGVSSTHVPARSMRAQWMFPLLTHIVYRVDLVAGNVSYPITDEFLQALR